MYEMIRAAHIQGIYTCIAGVLALIGGASAYWAARQETKRKEKQDKDLEAAYCIHMRAITEHAIGSINGLMSSSNSSIPYSQLMPIIESFSLDRWKDNSLLGLEALRNVSSLHANVSKWEKLSIENNGYLTLKTIGIILNKLENIKKEIDNKLVNEFKIKNPFLSE